MVKITGTQRLKAALLDDVKATKIKKVVKSTATTVQRGAMEKAGETYTKVDRKGNRYSTGATKQGINFWLRNNDLTAIVYLPQDYNPYTEYGTRFMAAEPVLGPVFKDSKTKFIADIKRLMK